MSHLQIVFGGQGGQGVRLISTLLGKACASAGRQVASSASYGPEVRGTYTRSEVIVSDEMIVYPRVLCPDVFVALSQEAYDRVRNEVAEGGVILFDAEAVTPARDTPARQLPVNAIETANRLGSPASANMVMLGAVVALTGAVQILVIEEMLPARRREENVQALECGYALLQGSTMDEDA